MTSPTLDPTAGERARAIRAQPAAPRMIPDPTDPRCGLVAGEAAEFTGGTRRIFDPTDPHCGELLSA